MLVNVHLLALDTTTAIDANQWCHWKRITWYNSIMNDNTPPPCFYCDRPSKYNEPSLDTGKIIDVCDSHFHFKYMG